MSVTVRTGKGLTIIWPGNHACIKCLRNLRPYNPTGKPLIHNGKKPRR